MAILINPTEVSQAALLVGEIYGPPGVGKTTLVVSAPTPVLIDADRGMRRIEKRFQVPSLPLTDYPTFLDLLASTELDPFESIVIDPVGRFLDRIADYLAASDARNRKTDGALSLAGFGRLRTEFQKVLRLILDHGKHLIFTAHDREDRDGDNRIIRPDGGPGASGKDLIKDLDFVGYMEMIGDARTISFSPCERFYAKNPWQLPARISVPDTKNGNTWIRDYLLARATERMLADEEENQRYLELIGEMKEIIAAVSNAKNAGEALAAIQKAPIIWDSLRLARRALADRTKELDLVYNRETKRFVKAEKPKAEAREEMEEEETADVAE